MTAFQLPVDIANRALQHCRMARIFDFTDLSTNAQETGFVYDKLRQAELRRNIWRFATKRIVIRPVDLGTVLFVPSAYAAATTYAIGAIVSYNNEYWQSKVGSNTGNTPAAGAFWQHYSGSITPDPFDYTNATIYYAGELVVVPPVWLVGQAYSQNAIVSYIDNNYYVSLTNNNTGNLPNAVSSTNWQLYQTWLSTTTNLLPPTYVSQPSIYLSQSNNNASLPGAANAGWLLLGGTVSPLQIVYPIGAGPLADLKTYNVYRLPLGYLRRAPTDPKANMPSAWLGATISPMIEDYVFEGNYIVTTLGKNILFRYIADHIDVPDMDPMFCEGLAARIATEVAPMLVHDKDLLGIIMANAAAHYKQEMFEARAVNAIEKGATEPPLDPYIAARF